MEIIRVTDEEEARRKSVQDLALAYKAKWDAEDARLAKSINNQRILGYFAVTYFIAYVVFILLMLAGVI